MRKLIPHILIFALITISVQAVQAQTAPAKQWDRTLGGSTNDMFSSMDQTSDGGYILGGTSWMGIGSDKTGPVIGSNDYWIVKVDANGLKMWDKTIGGQYSDYLTVIKQTTDGGYILGGYSRSNVSGHKSEPNRGTSTTVDFWVVKLDANGNKVWDKTLGGTEDDYLHSLQQTSDGGYIIGGTSYSGTTGDKTDSLRGPADIWIVKLDSSGNKSWDKAFCGIGGEVLSSLQQTSDGGYVLGGGSGSDIGFDKTENSKGSGDYWILKLDSAGNKIWDKTIGGPNYDHLVALQQTTDGGYILGGYSDSRPGGDKTQPFRGDFDYWVVKINANGVKQWDKTLGSTVADILTDIKQTSDGGYIAGGYTTSGISLEKSEVARGKNDYWIIKIDSLGTKVWDKTLGGSDDDELYALHQTADGGYIAGGTSFSNRGGDKSQPGKSGTDYWIVKLAPEIVGLAETQTTTLTLFPNPTTGLINLELKDQQPTQITVYNSLGQTILTKTEAQPNPDGKLQLDLSNQAKGIYTVQVISGNHSAVKKVVLQ